MDADWMDLLDEKNKEIERLREALQFYASKNNYETKKVWTTTLMIKNIAFPQYEPDGYKIVSQYHTPVLSDNGERARAALKEKEVMNKIDEEVQRVLKWIECRGYKDVFTVDIVITDLAPINHLSFQQVADVLNQEIRKGNIEIVASPEFSTKDLKWPLLKRIRKMDKSIERRFEVIEMMLQKISDKVDALPEKKQRLWIQHNEQSVPPGGMRCFEVDVMLASGEVLLNMTADQVFWGYYPDDPTNVIAWRKAE